MTNSIEQELVLRIQNQKSCKGIPRFEQQNFQTAAFSIFRSTRSDSLFCFVPELRGDILFHTVKNMSVIKTSFEQHSFRSVTSTSFKPVLTGHRRLLDLAPMGN